MSLWSAGLAQPRCQVGCHTGILIEHRYHLRRSLPAAPVLYRYWRAVRAHSEELLPLAPPTASCQGQGASCQLVGSSLVAEGEAGLDIAIGRPPLRDTLVAAGKAAGAGSQVGVFVGGECTVPQCCR